MNPMDFIQSLERHQQKAAAQPDPSEEFTKAQFSELKQEIKKSSAANRKFIEGLVKGYKPVATIDKWPDIASPSDIKQLIAVIKTLKPEAFDDSDTVDALKQLQTAVEGLKLAPQIKVSPTPVQVSPPIVKVDAPDFSKIEKAIKNNKPEPVDNSDLIDLLKKNLAATKKVSDTITHLKFPVANTPTDPLIYYLPADIDDTGAVQYFGYTDNKGAWYIRKYDTGATPKTLRFAFGQSNYPTNFTNRAGLTYNIWGS